MKFSFQILPIYLPLILLYANSISDDGPIIKFDPDGSTIAKQNVTTTIRIHDNYGISPDAVISYRWVYSNGEVLIGSEQKHKFKNEVVKDLSLTVNSPTGLDGKIKLIVTPISLSNEIALSTTSVAKSEDYLMDNTKPNIVINIYRESNGGKTGSVLLSKTN